MPTISEPTLERDQWAYARVRKAFIAEVIGEKTFEISLQQLGLCRQDIDAEIALAKMEMKRYDTR
jgi:hypothetical protein